ncbi:hypothetical protein GWK47_047822 [Chionoecetes opilio]|uniref:Uncharacterized protein n=1 Tax=Chionoecetes opilio TaxID=41210 RepID=A0A8J4Y3E0_CHIOP|nr:hypothetical protein GWK47_047822 [Chionoecetes opilio]
MTTCAAEAGEISGKNEDVSTKSMTVTPRGDCNVQTRGRNDNAQFSNHHPSGWCWVCLWVVENRVLYGRGSDVLQGTWALYVTGEQAGCLDCGKKPVARWCLGVMQGRAGKGLVPPPLPPPRDHKLKGVDPSPRRSYVDNRNRPLPDPLEVPTEVVLRPARSK